MRYHHRWLVFLVLVLLYASLHSQSVVVLDIQVTGAERIDRDLILSSCGIRIGEPFTADLVSTAIRNLYQLAVFDDVDVTFSEVPGGLRVHINVVELPVIARLNYIGNRKLSDRTLDEVGVLRLGSSWSGVVQAENTRRVLAEYRLKGYNMAQINYLVRQVSDGVSVRVEINEGKKVVVRKINIHGNREVASNKILKKMKTKQKGLFRTGTFEQDKYQEDLKAIIDFYNSQGYIDARILKTEEVMTDDRFLTLNIYVDEGEQYLFGKVNVRGNSHFDSAFILGLFRFDEGDTFDMSAFNAQVANVAGMYYEEGYIWAQFDPQMTKVGNLVNIMLVIEENTRARIHKIHISGNLKSKEKIIRRQLAIAPGDYFRRSRVQRSQMNIYNMGFFEPDMDLDYQAINNAGDVDLYLNVIDKASGSANGGIGYNSRDGVVGQFSISHNNLFGNYWQSNTRYELSGYTQNIEFDFTNPYLFDTDILFGFNAYSMRRDWTDRNFRVKRDGGGFRFGYPINFLEYARASVGYSLYAKQYEKIGSGTVTPLMASYIDKGRQITSSTNVTVSRDSRDNIFFPSSGSRIVLYGELAGGPFGGDFDYIKQISEISWFTPVFWEIVLRTKWRTGFIEGYGKGERSIPPPDERFVLGGTGADGIRGYSDGSVRPIVNGQPDNDGGKRSILFSTELGIPISTDQLYGLLFFDSGAVAHDYSDFNFKDFRKGVGAGIRIRTPFGLIGFDWAYNLETDRSEPHFQFGTTF